MLALVKPALLVFLTQAFILAGVFFISGQLTPQLFGSIYGMTNQLSRTVIASIVVFPLGNFLIAYAYSHFSPGLVAPLTIAALVTVNIAFAVLVAGTRVSWQLGLAFLLVLASCVWASVLLNQKA